MNDVVTDFQRMEAALRSRANNLHVQVESRVSEKTIGIARSTLRRVGDAAWLQVQTPPTEAEDRNDRIFFVQGGKFTAVDRLNAEWLQRAAAAGNGPVARLGATMGALDEGIRFVGNPVDTQDLVGRFKAVSGWKRTLLKDRIRYENGPRSSGMLVEIHANTYLPIAVELNGAKAKLRWSYTFLPSKKVAAPSVVGYTKVDAFLARPPLPKFDRYETEQLVRATLMAHRRFRRGTIQFSTGERIYLFDQAIGEDSAVGKWRFENGKLTMITRSGAFSGACKRGEVIGHLSSNGFSGVTNTTRDLLANRAPYRYDLTANLSARMIGQLQFQGRSLQLVEFLESARRVVWQIDTSTKRIYRIESEVRGRSSAAVSRATVEMKTAALPSFPKLAAPAGGWKKLAPLEG